MTETEIRQARFLDLLYDYDRQHPGQVPGVVDLLGDEYERQDQDIWRGILRQLDSVGYIKLAETMGFDGTGVMITGSGRENVQARRARRGDPARRNVAARDAVVRFLYAQPQHEAQDIEALLTNALARFEGDLLAMGDINAALVYLKRKDMIRGIGVAEQEAVLRPRLTDKGIDCAEHFEGSVADYVRRNEGGGGTSHTINIQGGVSGNLAWASETVTQTATTTTSGMAGDEIATLVKALKEASQVLDLEDGDRTALTRSLDVVEGELVNEQPDADIVRKFMQRALATVGKAAGSALSLVLTAYGKHLMQQAGIPIE